MDNSQNKTPTTRVEKTWEFLKWLLPDGPYRIETMVSEGKGRLVVEHFLDIHGKELREFVSTQNSEKLRRNFYFLPNATRLIGKRKKANLRGADFLHVDLDMKDYSGNDSEQFLKIVDLLLDKRVKSIPAPSAVWFTGGGFQAVWKLSKTIEVELAEELNYSLLMALQGGAGTHNADRLLRLPGTVNWLNDKKREAGRVPKLSLVASPDDFKKPPLMYAESDFKMKRLNPENNKKNGSKGKSVAAPSAYLEPLPLPSDLMEIFPSDPNWLAAIRDGINPPGKSYPSRSELVFAATIWMLGNGMESGHVLTVLTSDEFAISAHILEQPNAVSYATRQVLQALDAIRSNDGGWPVLGDTNLPVKNHPDNIRFAFSKLALLISRNVFAGIDEIVGGGFNDRDINDVSDILSSIFVRKFKFSATSAAINREIMSVAYDNTYHPILEYLGDLKWDGVERIDKWLVDFASADDTPFNRTVGRKVLVAAVRRIKKPGVKFDTLLVLEGKQGAGKSRLVGKLAISNDWFCESLSMKLDDKAKAELLSQAWIVEFQELDGIGKATSQDLKHFLSQRVDMYRKSYGKGARPYPRHSVIIGTTNESDYLRDLTGNRRIWPVLVGEIDLDGFSKVLDQLWAEAVVLEAGGERLELPKELWGAAAELQKRRLVEDPYSDVLFGALQNRTGKVSMGSIKQLLGIQSSRMTPQDSRRIKSIMAGIGWDSGTYRLIDPSGSHNEPRRGFASGSFEERKIEYISHMESDGFCHLILINNYGDEKEPF